VNPGHLYSIETCEDTGKPAIYKSTSYGGGRARLLVEHEDYFWEVYSVLAKYFEERAAKGSGVPGE
jgi:hypothetical protein